MKKIYKIIIGIIILVLAACAVTFVVVNKKDKRTSVDKKAELH